MKTIRTYIHISVLAMLFSMPLLAQQDSQYTQYMYNTITINPAYAGSRGLLSVNSIYRNQWVGLNGAPETIAASLHSPIGVRGVGLGLSFVNDEIGPSQETNMAVDFSYTIYTGPLTKLSFGLKGGFNLLNVNLTGSDLVFQDGDILATDINNRFTPMVGVGAYWHSDDWYVGLSSPNLLTTSHYNDDIQQSTVTEEIHAYLIGGYVFRLSPTTQFKPAALVKAVSGAPLAVDLSANFLFNEKFTLGAAYRWDAALSAMAAFQVTDQIMIGYAYDYDTTELGNFNSGSHEVFLRFELFNSVNRVVSPRFF